MDGKTKKREYTFKGQVWKYKGKSGWHFITLPKTLSRKIRKLHGLDEEGWGRLKTLAKIGKTRWNTAIWYDSKFQSYLLPVKSLVRRAERIETDSKVTVVLVLEESTRASWLAGRNAKLRSHSIIEPFRVRLLPNHLTITI